MPSSVLHGESPYHIVFPEKSLFPIDRKVFGCTCFVRDGEDDDLLLYHIVKSVPETPPDSATQSVSLLDTTAPPLPETPVRSSPQPLAKVYTRRKFDNVTNPPVPDSFPTPSPLSQDPALDDDRPIALRKGKRSCAYPIPSFVSYDHLSSSSRSFVVSLNSITLPKTVNEALPYFGWQAAIVEEMNAVNDNGIWDLVDSSVGKQVVGFKWVFAVKTNPDGSIAWLKARLVAKAYTQTYGVDYLDTFALVSKLTSVRLFHSLAATYD
ncbi:hypothetical protein LIER_17588 [Lithospermum erythrorhizon]|uniref:Reverse transcriptase Ty1/copia-type domain-containing protein n=1 Tax=Lithospermum erythrorhizon TaxID=34254 RepID=A0AAV3QE56_LITER